MPNLGGLRPLGVLFEPYGSKLWVLRSKTTPNTLSHFILMSVAGTKGHGPKES